MKNTSLTSKRANNRRLPALVAVGGSLVALPAAAIELGDLTVQSSLGQPLRASIAYALAPTEQVSSQCVSLRPGATASGLPNVGRATVSVANGVIKLTGATAVREPMVAAHLVVNCQYSANISREYMLFIDPLVIDPLAPAHEQIAGVEQPTSPAVPAPTATNIIAPAPVQQRRVQRAPVQKDINLATRHKVTAGESLSEIAARIENRGVGLWTAVDAIFAANPDAFMDNDPNKLMAGTWLTIPDFNAGETATAIVAPVEVVVSDVDEIVLTPADSMTSDVTTNDLQPGTGVVEDNPFVAPPVTEIVDIPDTELEAPTTTSTSPNVTTAVISETAATAETTTDSGSSPWWVWLAASGVAIALALILFGRRFRARPEAIAVAPLSANPGRRATDTTDTEQLAVVDVDYDLTDESPTEENLVLDADLVLGTGLENGTDLGGSELDIELPPEPAIQLESEIMPIDDDYDMSVIMDATRVPQLEEITERDLKAVAVDTDNDTMITDSYTISKEVDFEILEQDYENEMTATQALNEEITRAAAELAASTEDDDAAPGDETSVLPLATVTELDVTSHLPARGDMVGDEDETGINEVLTESMPTEDKTVEMPSAENDEQDEQTVEMQVESGTVG